MIDNFIHDLLLPDSVYYVILTVQGHYSEGVNGCIAGWKKIYINEITKKEEKKKQIKEKETEKFADFPGHCIPFVQQSSPQ